MSARDSNPSSEESHLPSPSPSRLTSPSEPGNPSHAPAQTAPLEHSALVLETVDHNALPALAHDSTQAEAEPRQRRGVFGAADRERLLRGYAEYGDDYDGEAERADRGIEGRGEGSQGVLEAEDDDGSAKDGAAKRIGASFWRLRRRGVGHPRSM